MTVKRRLFLSNLLMIAVPVLIAALVGFACIAAVMQVVENGMHYGMDDEAEIYIGSRAIAEYAESALQADSSLSAKKTETLKTLLDGSYSRMQIYRQDELLFDYGEVCDPDEQLIQAAKSIQGTDVTVSSGSRIAYHTPEQIQQHPYDIYVLTTQKEGMSAKLKTAILLAGFCLLALLLLSIILTNRVLTKHVFKNIAEPLDTLTTAVQEIGGGNLAYRISYSRADEFKPACDAFNEMGARLKASVEKTRREEESRKELLAGISHDLRSPLTSIKAYVEGLLDGIAKTPEEQQRYLKTIQRKAEDIDRMVNQIFIFSKLEMDEYPLDLVETRLDVEIAELLQTAAAEYEAKGLEIRCTALTPYTVSIDKAQFERIIKNILDNSAKYKTKDVGHMLVSLKSHGPICELRFTDDGPGVAEAALPKLFEAFYRTDPARKNPAGGSGLGLSIAAKAIKRMGGGICAENEPNGSGFSIILTLPGKKGDSHENEEDTDCGR